LVSPRYFAVIVAVAVKDVVRVAVYEANGFVGLVGALAGV
jgi:hypothetical protein